MNKKTFACLETAGLLYEQNGVLDEEIIQQFGQLYRYSEKQLRHNRLFHKFGLTNIFWKSMLKKHNAYQKRFDKPFAP